MLTTTVAGRTWDFSHSIGSFNIRKGFWIPVAVAADPDGMLYVLSRGRDGEFPYRMRQSKRITKVPIDQDLVDDVAGEFAYEDLTLPAGLAIDRDRDVYCSDEYENLILVYSADGDRLGQWGETGSGEGQFDGPSGLAFDADDSLYVVDSRNNRVQRFTKDGRFLLSWGGSGSGDGLFNRPWGITVDQKGDVYVADWGNSRVQKFSPEGAPILSFGPSSGDGGDLDHPADVAVDSEGDVYVTDWGNKRVQIYDPDGGIVTSLHGDAQELSKWAQWYVDDSLEAQELWRMVEAKDLVAVGKFDRPLGILVDERDRIVVSDSYRGRVQVYSKRRE